MITEACYWDQNDETRAFTEGFPAHGVAEPTMVHASVNSAVLTT